jgi:hypothetical protein
VSYIPDGYLSTQQAIHSTFETRHPDLQARRLEIEAEREALTVLDRQPSRAPPPLIPLGSRQYPLTRRTTAVSTGGPVLELDAKRNLTERLEYLRDLKAAATKVNLLFETATVDLHRALAEGYLASDMLCDDGQINPISLERWRALGGLTGVRTGRLGPEGLRWKGGTVLIKVAEFQVWLDPGSQLRARTHAISAQGAAVGAEVTKATSCPVTCEDFLRVRDPVPLLAQWAAWRYGTGQPPSREQLLLDHRHDFGRISGISDMRALRRALATQAAKLGGAPTHRTS